jgi:hypothetical protein
MPVEPDVKRIVASSSGESSGHGPASSTSATSGAIACSTGSSIGRQTIVELSQRIARRFARGGSAMMSLGSVSCTACSISNGSHQPLRSVAIPPALMIAM